MIRIYKSEKNFGEIYEIFDEEPYQNDHSPGLNVLNRWKGYLVHMNLKIGPRVSIEGRFQRYVSPKCKVVVQYRVYWQVHFERPAPRGNKSSLKAAFQCPASYHFNIIRRGQCQCFEGIWRSFTVIDR